MSLLQLHYKNSDSDLLYLGIETVSYSLLERFSYDLENGFGKCSLFVLSANG